MFAEKDDCQKDIADTAEVQKEWIRRLELKGACTCDREHMYDCDDTMGGSLGSDEMSSVFAGVIPDQVTYF